jgi:hypothetical protein
MMTSLDAHDPPPTHEDASRAETQNIAATSSHPDHEDERQGILSELPAAVAVPAVCVVRAVPAVCQELYVDSGNDKMVLYLLSIGLKNILGEPLVAFDKEPWCSLPKNQFRSPKNTDLVTEIRRRAHEGVSRNMTSIPRPTNWTRMQMMDWLESNPVSDAPSVDFLTSEVLRLHEVHQRMESERRQQHESSADTAGAANASSGQGGGSGPWRGNVPYMRIIMCLTEDDVKALFLARANTLSRAELDARNSISRYVS